MHNYKELLVIRYRIIKEQKHNNVLYKLQIKRWYWPFWYEPSKLVHKLYMRNYIGAECALMYYEEKVIHRSLVELSKAYIKYRSYRRTHKEVLKQGTLIGNGFIESI